MGKAELKLEIDADLLAQAKASGVDLVAITEAAGRNALKSEDPEARARQWAEENAEALKAQRERIDTYGVFGEDLRAWRLRPFEVHRNPSERARERIPYVVVLQSHLLAASHTTVVAPLLRQDGRSGLTRISTSVEFAGEEFIVLVGELGAVDTRLLRSPVGDLQVYEDDIRRALDRPFTGF